MRAPIAAIAAAAIAAAAIAAAAIAAPKPNAGERAYQKCYSCHAIEADRNDLAGPSLHGIVGRPVAAVQGFDYSPAMKRFARQHPRWTTGLLDRYAADPEALVPGTSMSFHGMSDPTERRALLDYLERLGD